jgi:hypothetical protein
MVELAFFSTHRAEGEGSEGWRCDAASELGVAPWNQIGRVAWARRSPLDG